MNIEKRMLISVTDKRDVERFADSLHRLGFNIVSTGGTASFLERHKIPVTHVSEVTGFPEIMDGRLKTLHPKIFGGILGRPQDQSVMKQYDIRKFGIVCVNLYSFASTVAQPDCTHEQAIEQIDIGGPALIRAAAKNYLYTYVVTSLRQYARVLSAIEEGPEINLTLSEELAAAAFAYTAAYDTAISEYFEKS